MQSKLNSDLIKHRMNESGMSVQALAKALDVSREIIYNWLSGDKSPQPKNILGLTRTLKIPFKELFVPDAGLEPVVAFRKRAGTKTTDRHIENAINMGLALEPLVPYMGFPKFRKPSTFINPRNDFQYVQEVANEFRKEKKLSDIIDYHELIGVFPELHSVLIPVLWGQIKSHENALHVYLPKSTTTWIYLNLDTNPLDFKFWMAHEIGHILAPDLRGNDGEDFADNFAGALLFPMELAKAEHAALVKLSNSQRVQRVQRTATHYKISMWTVVGETNKFAKAHNLPEIVILNIGAIVTTFNKKFKLVSEAIFQGKKPEAKDYIKLAEEFQSPFFNGLKAFLKENRKSSSIISRVLNIPAHDAQAIFEDLSSGNP